MKEELRARRANLYAISQYAKMQPEQDQLRVAAHMREMADHAQTWRQLQDSQEHVGRLALDIAEKDRELARAHREISQLRAALSGMDRRKG